MHARADCFSATPALTRRALRRGLEGEWIYPRLVNGRYALADTPEERMAIAVVAAIHSYFVQHPKGVAPGQGFLAECLKPFLERELLEARLDELHKLSHFGTRERELLDTLHRTLRGCSERIQHA